ncbi:MAG: ComEC/Rec2 family competence protein [Bryobacteraceae bacterium]
MQHSCFVALAAIMFCAAAKAQSSAKTFDMYITDVEGGHAVLYVSPTGEPLLEDTGNPGQRDHDRIMEVLNAAGVKKIDHLITTHYHGDHVGGLEELAKSIPIEHYIDHGPTAEEREQVKNFQATYAGLYSKAKHSVVKPGDKIPFGSVDVTVVTSAQQVIKKPLPDGGIANPACGEFKPRDDSDTQAENRQSVGVVYTYGKYRSVNLGDFTFNEEQQLMCPSNPIGHVSLFLTSHHGINQSNSFALVHGLAPTVAIMHNSSRKGGALTTMQALWTSPGLQDLWQLHWAYAAGIEYNAPGLFIANMDDAETIAGVITGKIPAGMGGVGGGRGRADVPGTPTAGSAPPQAVPGASALGPQAGGPGGPGGPGAGFGGGRGGHNGPAFYIKVSARADGRSPSRICGTASARRTARASRFTPTGASASTGAPRSSHDNVRVGMK